MAEIMRLFLKFLFVSPKSFSIFIILTSGIIVLYFVANTTNIDRNLFNKIPATKVEKKVQKPLKNNGLQTTITKLKRTKLFSTRTATTELNATTTYTDTSTQTLLTNLTSTSTSTSTTSSTASATSSTASATSSTASATSSTTTTTTTQKFPSNQTITETKLTDLNITEAIQTNNTEQVNETSTYTKCDLISKKLIGYKPYDLEKLKQPISENEVTRQLWNQNISLGGKWSPSYCQARHHVAILISYRDREHHLKQFLFHMHPLFARQELSYGIYVIEPVQNITFNRGILMNIGFIESNKDSNDLWQCHAYHDVDLISEDDRTLYHCPESPTHIAHRMSKYQYKPFYSTYFGGVSLIKKEQYNISNGYSNQYFGWGGEDDDHQRRLVKKGFKTVGPPEPLGRYLMFSHDPDTPNPIRHQVLKTGDSRVDTDGLNSIKYKIIEKIITPLYTKYLVYYNQTEILPPELVKSMQEAEKKQKKEKNTKKS